MASAAAMQRATVHEIAVPAAGRAAFLVRDYPHFTADPEGLAAKLTVLREPCGGRQVAEWQTMLREGRWLEFTASILERHYDPVYRRSFGFPGPSVVHELASVTDEALDCLAGELAAADAAAAVKSR